MSDISDQRRYYERMMDEIAAEHQKQLDQLRTENAKLREYVTKLEMANIDVTARLADYIGQYDPTDAFVAEVKDENAKLRELCKMFAEYVSKDRCEGCVVKCRCNDGEVEECWQRTEIRKVARELRIEVDE